MKTSEYKGYEIPLPVKGQVEVEIVDYDDKAGRTPDDNGDCSEGMEVTFSITNPPDAKMTDGTSAVGYTFKQTWWIPRQSLMAKNPQTAARMKKEITKLLEATFGEDVPEEVLPPMWIGRKIFIDVGSKYDDFQKDNVAVATRIYTAKDMTGSN